MRCGGRSGLTTVGYGDRFPVTLEGRLVAAMLMAAGVALFGTLSGLVAFVVFARRAYSWRGEHLPDQAVE